MIFGFNNLPDGMDPFDNEYFELAAYDWNHQNSDVGDSTKIPLKVCSEKDLDLLPKAARVYYSKSFCFAKREMVVLKDDWYASTYHIPFVAFTHCDSTKR